MKAWLIYIIGLVTFIGILTPYVALMVVFEPPLYANAATGILLGILHGQWFWCFKDTQEAIRRYRDASRGVF